MHFPRHAGRLALLAVIILAAGMSAMATVIDDVRLAADCNGYTLFIEGSNFDEGTVLTVEYQFVLTYLGADPARSDITVSGTVDVSCDPFQPDPGLNTCSPSLEMNIPWTEALGEPIPCGEYELDTTTSLGTCDSIASHWSWHNIYGSRLCNNLRPTGWETPDTDPYPDWDGFLSCSCDRGTEICRTPGFWGTHAGTEKRGRGRCGRKSGRRGRNITQEVLDAAIPPVMVCGEILDNTGLGMIGSALESTCVRPRGDRRLRLARQLTATALNCVMTNGSGDCAGTSIEQTFASCNRACANAWDDEIRDCIRALDCFNKGGRMLDDGMCQIGTCEDDPSMPCASDRDCRGDDDDHDSSWGDDDEDDDHHHGDRDDDDEDDDHHGDRDDDHHGDRDRDHDRGGRCIPLPGNCHDQPLVNEALGLDFDPPGPAGSARACRKARRNHCTIFGGCGD